MFVISYVRNEIWNFDLKRLWMGCAADCYYKWAPIGQLCVSGCLPNYLTELSDIVNGIHLMVELVFSVLLDVLRTISQLPNIVNGMLLLLMVELISSVLGCVAYHLRTAQHCEWYVVVADGWVNLLCFRMYCIPSPNCPTLWMVCGCCWWLC